MTNFTPIHNDFALPCFYACRHTNDQHTPRMPQSKFISCLFITTPTTSTVSCAQVWKASILPEMLTMKHRVGCSVHAPGQSFSCPSSCLWQVFFPLIPLDNASFPQPQKWSSSRQSTLVWKMSHKWGFCFNVTFVRFPGVSTFCHKSRGLECKD